MRGACDAAPASCSPGRFHGLGQRAFELLEGEQELVVMELLELRARKTDHAVAHRGRDKATVLEVLIGVEY